MGVGTWNLENSLELTHGKAPRTVVRLHIAGNIPGASMTALRRAIGQTTPARLRLVGGAISTLGDNKSSKRAVHLLASEYVRQKGFTGWTIRVYHDSNPTLAKKDFLEVFITAAVPKDQLAAAEDYLENKKNLTGKTALAKAFKKNLVALELLEIR